ncbi:MAG: SDR family NAD(P)-dependent oxidoreductase, partial [Terriglobales bacterium]
MAGTLVGKVAIVTGAARGIGASEARMLVERGAKVVLTDLLDDLGR